ncbi:Methyl-cpg-binding domain-containing protein 8 [Quillaja saponaria]|uniref:Methyl-cpg-binding domain-containing protein 8 n=1 Tax=Quillaja saponaria TaxID=32244 RepID=A0AAD7M3W2_QUISA|nr:Methyl-cpg-binding domain-containing protein 8 [Quillaja saponaria]
MVTTSTIPPASAPPQGLKLESLSRIDISTLSQSELQALSLCSPSAFDLHSTHDLVTPKIDRASFHESAGSRRQTYSRPRKPLSNSASPTGHRRRVAGLLPTPKLPPVPADDPENKENRKIIDYLKQFIRKDPKFDQVELISPTFSMSVSSNPEMKDGMVDMNGKVELGLVKFGGERKRKRGRKPKAKVHLEECYKGMEIVNKNGIAIDLAALANVEDPFSEELRKRTVGLETEEQLLGFLRDLSGQWGSRRKKRKIVDADNFGDVFPIGWKLLLGLKRKDGHAWIYCRRYISPTGQQFVSCKEASSHLQSFFGLRNAQWSIICRDENIQQDDNVTSENNANFTGEGESQRQIVVASSNLPSSSISNEREKEVSLLGIENLAEVQIHDLFECHKCSMTFDEKDSYLKHLLSSHQRTTRRYRLGSSVGDGVIVKDGKFECQFCHKVFLERRRYNGHVGIHVRNYVRRVEEPPGQTILHREVNSPTIDDMPARISKMDALIEIAQNSILEDSSVEPSNKTIDGSSPDNLNLVSAPEIAFGKSDHDVNFDSPVNELEMLGSVTERNLQRDLNEHMIFDGIFGRIDDSNETDANMDTHLDNADSLSANKQNVNVFETLRGKDGMALITDGFDEPQSKQERVSQSLLLAPVGNQIIPQTQNNTKSGCNNTEEHVKLDQVHNSPKDDELKFEFGGSNAISGDDNVSVTVKQISEENVVHSGVSISSMSLGHQLDSIPPSGGSTDKGEKQVCSVNQKHDNVNGFEDMRLDEIETLNYSFATGVESLSLPNVPVDLANSTDIKGAYATSAEVESQELLLNMAVRHQLTTVCVWCGVEFDHDAVDSEIQPDSVGFMCPTCKAKISGQINVLDSGSPMNSHGL